MITGPDEHHATATYTSDVLSYAARRVAVYQIQWHGFLGFGLLVVITLALYMLGTAPLFVGAGVATLFFCALVGISLVIVPYRRSKSVFDKLPNRTVDYSFSATGWGARSELGTQQTSWKTIEAIIRDSRVWLFKLYGGSGYVTIPAAALDEPTRSFVVEQVLRNGGKVLGKDQRG